MSTALKLACQHVVEDLGICPYDVHSLDCADWEDDCERRCKPNIDMAECWERYFVMMEKRKGKRQVERTNAQAEQLRGEGDIT